MRFFTAALALFASVALAQQNNAISIPNGQSTLDVTAGQPVTITWTKPSSGTVTIKLQQQGTGITPTSGIVLTSDTPAAAETFTFTVDPSEVNSFPYTIEIIDNTDPNNYNFSPPFGISNAKGTSTGTASTTVSETATTGSSSATGSTTATGSSTSSASTSGSSGESTTAAKTSSGSSSSAASTATTEGSTATSTATAASATTSVPNSNGAAADLKIQGSLVALVAVAVAVF